MRALRWVVVLVGLWCCPAAADMSDCDGPFKGRKPAVDELAAIIKAHEQFLRDEDKPSGVGVHAKLCGADLRYTSLQGKKLNSIDLSFAVLTAAHLSGAQLGDANLHGATLVNTNLEGASLIRADLSGATLLMANLSNADFQGANLEGASLVLAYLTGANLQSANLSNAGLWGANLSGADLSYANLKGAALIKEPSSHREAKLRGASILSADMSNANLAEADLTGALLAKTNLSGAYLVSASLRGAELTESNLSGAKFHNANLAEVHFNPKLGLPDVTGMAFARNLRLMRVEEASRPTLSELRDAFKKAGFRDAERDMTYLLKVLDENKELQEFPLEGWFNRVLFHWTCDYGASPGRPLRLLFGFVALFSLAYLYALTRKGESALWAIWSPDRVNKAEGQTEPVRLSYAQPFPPEAAPKPYFDLARDAWLTPEPSQPPPTTGRFARTGRALVRLRNAWGLALYFSLLSAFHFGWRDLNVGNWIARIQPREYALRPTGWVRMVSGLQSLISVYLVALWALSYFGRPFE